MVMQRVIARSTMGFNANTNVEEGFIFLVGALATFEIFDLYDIFCFLFFSSINRIYTTLLSLTFTDVGVNSVLIRDCLIVVD